MMSSIMRQIFAILPITSAPNNIGPELRRNRAPRRANLKDVPLNIGRRKIKRLKYLIKKKVNLHLINNIRYQIKE